MFYKNNVANMHIICIKGKILMDASQHRSAIKADLTQKKDVVRDYYYYYFFFFKYESSTFYII